jgi:hypothetical protein
MDSEMERVIYDAVMIIAFHLDVEENQNKTSSDVRTEAQASYFLNPNL